MVRSMCEMETTASDYSGRPDETHVVEMLRFVWQPLFLEPVCRVATIPVYLFGPSQFLRLSKLNFWYYTKMAVPGRFLFYRNGAVNVPWTVAFHL